MQTALNKSEYRKKVLGCWLGKAAGGTLGTPFEGQDGPLALDYYNPVPTTMLPNDDLDLQVLWACVMADMKEPKVDKNIIADAWLKHVEFPWDEYGVCLRNLRNGIRPPFSGICDNWFNNGMGAAIRSEIWACLAPGNPMLAAQYAYEDACTDHSGDGIWAEMFFSVMESICFRENDLELIILKSASYLPLESKVRGVSIDTMAWWKMYGDLMKVREMILAKYGHPNFTDTIQNVGFTVLGLLAGDGDFGKTICCAVNCGKDTDCTGATAGAIFGILHPDQIGEKWLKPIGRSLVLNKQITGITHPPTLDGFTDMISILAEKLSASNQFVESSEPSLIKAEIAFVDLKKFKSDLKSFTKSEIASISRETKPAVFPGNYAYVPKEVHAGKTIAVRYAINVKEGFKGRMMLSTCMGSALYMDGILLFEGTGKMIPSFHRAGQGHFMDVELSSGSHEIVALMAANPSEDASWVFGVGNSKNCMWRTDVLPISASL
ncbi:MAG: hypothetical protein A2X45_01945 [Lentisphaerae bacterium GWF2_50_93]|nr:MAG: hypothetical protein A2X45_01945 [Lentisphaerae bacterium GWF2_50_93]